MCDDNSKEIIQYSAYEISVNIYNNIKKYLMYTIISLIVFAVFYHLMNSIIENDYLLMIIICFNICLIITIIQYYFYLRKKPKKLTFNKDNILVETFSGNNYYIYFFEIKGIKKNILLENQFGLGMYNYKILIDSERNIVLNVSYISKDNINSIINKIKLENNCEQEFESKLH